MNHLDKASEKQLEKYGLLEQTNKIVSTVKKNLLHAQA